MKKLRNILVMIFFILAQSVCYASNVKFVDNIQDGLALSESSKIDMLVVFTAPWCTHCHRLEKDIKNKGLDHPLIVCYINYDDHPDLVKEYQVRKIPDYFILRQNIEITRKVGYSNYLEFSQWINSYVK